MNFTFSWLNFVSSRHRVISSTYVAKTFDRLLTFSQFLDVGVVTGIEANHKPLHEARKGMEVCVKIEPIPGEAPKMYGRHFDHTDLLVSKVSEFQYSLLLLSSFTVYYYYYYSTVIHCKNSDFLIG